MRFKRRQSERLSYVALQLDMKQGFVATFGQLREECFGRINHRSSLSNRRVKPLHSMHRDRSAVPFKVAWEVGLNAALTLSSH